MWNVQCGNTTPFGSPQTNPPFGQTTTTQFQQSPLPQQTTSSGQFQQTPQPPIGPTQSSGPFVQPTQSTLPQFTTSQQLASMQCNIATICDPYVAAGGKQCTVATGAQCFCNLQGAVYAKTCPSTPATVGNLGGCTTESKKLCDQQCVGSQATCDCNPDGSVRGVKCVQGTATKDDTGDASSLGASLALVGVTLLAMQFN
jgi:hypothetical protein